MATNRQCGQLGHLLACDRLAAIEALAVGNECVEAEQVDEPFDLAGVDWAK
jgi:hypothetical protein